MNAIILEGTEAFVSDAMKELSSKGMRQINSHVAVGVNIRDFDSLTKGLKALSSYRNGKDAIYRTQNLTKLS